jgi:quinol monooxygenase YgiN
MATLLCHIRVRPGMEARFEEIVTELHDATHEREPAMRRYEYWRGAEPGLYYALLSFDDFDGFLVHQSSPHHEEAVPKLAEVIESNRIEWVDPVPTASPLAPTHSAPLRDGAGELEARYHARFAPGVDQAWWAREA